MPLSQAERDPAELRLAAGGDHGFFWPVFPIAGWGIGVIMNAWDVCGRQDITEDDIQREMHRLSK